jgi:hypothetical protein
MTGTEREAGMVRGILALTVGLALLSAAAGAVTILDSTWKAEGGGKGHEADGFGAHLRLAAEPKFASVLALSTDGETWGEASGTWIGNDAGHAYILTAAHIYERPAKAGHYVVRGPDGKVLRPDRLWVHPQWNGDTDTRTGDDLVILRLPVALQGLGPQPMLYAGAGEAGQVITFVGYGSRGIGSTGQQDRFYQGSDKAAAQGMVDQWVAPTARRSAGDGGNYLGIYLPREDGTIPNPYGGKARPATRLVGLLGSGDSGGSAWMETKAGRWVIVGVNSNGSGTASYGDSSWFARVAPHREWIAGIYPGVLFGE